MDTIATVTVGENGFNGLVDKVKSINKRAKRLGMDLVVVTVKREFTVVNEKSGYDIPKFEIEITGTAPKIGDYTLAAVIENTETIGTVVKVIPGPYDSDDYTYFEGYDFGSDGCDHCGHIRNRKSVFVLKEISGNRKCVGSTCVKDFLDTEDAKHFAAWAEFCDQVVECGNADPDDFRDYSSGRFSPIVNLELYLTAVAVCSRQLGWLSRGACAEDSGLEATADSAYYLLLGSGQHWEEFVDCNKLHYSDNDKANAAEAIEWAKTLLPTHDTYLSTIGRIATAGQTEPKLAGFAASIVSAYKRATADKLKREDRDAGKVFVGEVKERLKNREVTVIRLKTIPGYREGVTTIVSMELDMGEGKIAPLVWFATGSKDFKENTKYTLTGTVKEHKDCDNWGRSTVVNYCKLLKM